MLHPCWLPQPWLGWLPLVAIMLTYSDFTAWRSFLSCEHARASRGKVLMSVLVETLFPHPCLEGLHRDPCILRDMELPAVVLHSACPSPLWSQAFFFSDSHSVGFAPLAPLCRCRN